jgi:hypothetical protein
MPRRTVRLLVAAGLVSAAVAAACWLVRVADPYGHGLRAAYFASVTGGGEPVLTSIDAVPSDTGVRDAWHGAEPEVFSAEWTGAITVLRSGRYTFRTTADDGAMLYIDRGLVVDNGGRHPAQAATGGIDLSPGTHAFLLQYVQAGEDHALAVEWSRNGGAFALVPAWAFRRRTSVGLARALPGALATLLWPPAVGVAALALSLALVAWLVPIVAARVGFGAFALGIPLSMAAVVAYASWTLYSPVPFYDEWDAELDWAVRALDGSRAAWWEQYNEHRLVLTRLLEFPVVVHMAGREWILNVVAFTLLAVCGWMFWRLLRVDASQRRVPAENALAGAFIAGWLFLWSQRETLAWGFNVAFVLAMALLLCALFVLSRHGTTPSTGDRVAAGIIGAAAVGSMANGVLILPCLAAYALWQRLGWRTVAAYATLAVGGAVAYAAGYATPEVHGSVLVALRTQHAAIAEFVILFLGAPFRWLAGENRVGDAVGPAAGVAYIVIWVLAGRTLLADGPRRPVRTAAWIFAAYVLATALITATGRTLVFGPKSALWSRYSTAAVWGWAALFLWLASRAGEGRAPARHAIGGMVVAFSVLMIGRQVTAWDERGGLFSPRREISALALAMNVRDETAIQRVYQSPSWALDVAGRAASHHISIFAAFPYRDLRSAVGQPFAVTAERPCLGGFDDLLVIPSQRDMLRVRGWIVAPGVRRPVPERIRVVAEGITQGFALGGIPRPTLGDVDGPDAVVPGFVGYLPARLAGTVVTLLGENPACVVQATVPPGT